MRYYPAFLDVRNKNCLVVGGGAVGVRKALTLEKCGARVKVISDRFPEKTGLAGTSICTQEKKYEKQDVKGMFLVFAATNRADLNQKIKEDASSFNILCNVADAPDDSDFLVPSTLDREDLIVAISTSGASPAMARKIRQDLDQFFDPAYARLMRLLKNIRRKLIQARHAPDEHRQMFHSLIDLGLLEWIRAEDEVTINAVLYDIFGPGYIYQELVSFKE